MLDIDGYRIDKALTITVDAQAEWSDYIRECARKVGKTNFFIPGEIVGGNALAALYVGRGKEPRMSVETVDEAYRATNVSNSSLYIRESHALDAACFHYSIYRALTRFLGIDGIYGAEMDTRINWAEGWEDILKTNDMINVNTGRFDPRHMYGVSNQDVFRWPGIQNGTQKYLVGAFVTTLMMPGISILNWGEEQAFYVLENIAGNYLYGRQPMSSTISWELHGCYKVGSEKYFNFPLDASLYGCEDPNVSLDHRDPSHPVRVIIKRLNELRSQYPVLNDGFDLFQLSNHTHWIYLPGSNGTGTELGLWSNVRARRQSLQNFSAVGGNQMVWTLLGNENSTTAYTFNCSDEKTALISPFDSGVTVKNLLYPYEEYTLEPSTRKLGLENSTAFNGCLREFTMPAWGFKALVPVVSWKAPTPSITKFLPGHDYRLELTGSEVEFHIHFSTEMDCESVSNGIQIQSETIDKSVPFLDRSTVKCQILPLGPSSILPGEVQSVWSYSATLRQVSDGIHRLTVRNVTDKTLRLTTGSTDHFLLRVGKLDNPMVFPRHANYSREMVYQKDNGIFVRHKAAGASKFRCSQTWGSNWTDWIDYTGQDFRLPEKQWSGTSLQGWTGDHVTCQYFSKLAGSSHHQQEGDLTIDAAARRFPHLFLNGHFNEFGFDGGIPNQLLQNTTSGQWSFDLMAEWPTSIQFNVWGMNPDGLPDQTWIFGDVNFDFVLDRLPPGSLRQNVVNVTDSPPAPFTGWRITVEDLAMRYQMVPTGNRSFQIAVFSLFWVVPAITSAIVVFCFMVFFYQVKLNTSGTKVKSEMRMMNFRKNFKRMSSPPRTPLEKGAISGPTHLGDAGRNEMLQMDMGAARRKVLIATMEYEIEDWEIKIKIGGLGVMSQLMAKTLGHLDLIWVVPCVGGLDKEYPVDQIAEPMIINILGSEYTVQVQYHVVRNITYVILDAPIFRLQTKANPYPARMDDLDSAIYYSAWNQCIAESLTRFEADVYHINDFHGALAPLYLLPKVTPCCLSLHNAEFQGMWPMRTPSERDEVCKVFNIDFKIVERFVQFGDVFNLLHAGASYLKEFQGGFGAVGVSKKYGKRSYARYPIFWGLSKIGSLPNPDPTDTAAWNPDQAAIDSSAVIEVNPQFEAGRAELRRQAQEWAGLEQRPDAELFVFVGRWSMQKGVDLIADVFPSLLENNSRVQLIAIGPVIDLYGKFAAIKLAKLMELYPGRVYSKPEFTSLPKYIFSGAEFALIPSRDEPFGLVAVEFGRVGALGVGSRVGKHPPNGNQGLRLFRANVGLCRRSGYYAGVVLYC
jgi:alpha-1,3-glucan synthase